MKKTPTPLSKARVGFGSSLKSSSTKKLPSQTPKPQNPNNINPPPPLPKGGSKRNLTDKPRQLNLNPIAIKSGKNRSRQNKPGGDNPMGISSMQNMDRPDNEFDFVGRSKSPTPVLSDRGGRSDVSSRISDQPIEESLNADMEIRGKQYPPGYDQFGHKLEELKYHEFKIPTDDSISLSDEELEEPEELQDNLNLHQPLEDLGDLGDLHQQEKEVDDSFEFNDDDEVPATFESDNEIERLERDVNAELQMNKSPSETQFDNISHNHTQMRNLVLDKGLLSNEIEKLTKKNLSLNLDSELLSKKLDEQLTQNAILRDQLETEKENLEKIKQEGHNTKRLQEQIDEQNEHIEEIEFKINELKKENFQLLIEKESYQSEITTYQLEVDRWMDEKIQFEGDNEDLQNKLKSMEIENKKLKEEGAQIKNEIDDIKGELEKQFEELKAKPLNDWSSNMGYGDQNKHAAFPQGSAEIEKWKQLYEGEKASNLKLIKEKEKLKEALRREQSERIEGSKDLMELEERLKFGEKQMTEAQEARIAMKTQLQNQHSLINSLSKKMAENEELIQICATFLQRNGVLSNSFLSEEELYQLLSIYLFIIHYPYLYMDMISIDQQLTQDNVYMNVVLETNQSRD